MQDLGGFCKFNLQCLRKQVPFEVGAVYMQECNNGFLVDLLEVKKHSNMVRGF